jgi:hypothetical protein
MQALLQFSQRKSNPAWEWERATLLASSGPSDRGERSLPALLPHPLLHARIVTLTKTLVREYDVACSDAGVGRDQASDGEGGQGHHKSEGQNSSVEDGRGGGGSPNELRASLGLLETMREATHSELHNAQQLSVSSLFLLSLTSWAGSSALGHLEFGLPFLHSAGKWVELMDEHGTILMLEEMVGKVCVCGV